MRPLHPRLNERKYDCKKQIIQCSRNVCFPFHLEPGRKSSSDRDLHTKTSLKKTNHLFFFATEFEQKCIKDIRSGKESEMVDLISGGEIEMQIKE